MLITLLSSSLSGGGSLGTPTNVKTARNVITHREHATISTRREPNGLEERYFLLLREMLYAYYHTGMVEITNH